ncbi:putative cell surface spherulin 4-like protein [Phaeomoniella chlamydospora]|uniref:Putative cell surface spherulin 4-like protein n=1 Tax=Phaeomoniella chlamydospora TaxID=158046 RepID=A0A0G2FV28_PHACM|nr:putative cell surface spherulin 4-like protein [Phaeomoniella chlamydospora]
MQILGDDAVASAPDVQFNIIINPASGPGSTVYPDSNYIAGVAKLNSYSNTKLLGYVPTTYARRSQSSVLSDIDRYAKWSTYKAADIHMDGIFFDETPSTYTSAAASYMSTISARVKSSLGSANNYIVFNPGVVVDSRYYNYANLVVAWENYAKYFSTSSSISAIPKAVRAKTAVILHHFTGTTTTQKTIINNIVNQGVKGVYITSSSDFTSYPQLWTSFCSTLRSATYRAAAKLRI